MRRQEEWLPLMGGGWAGEKLVLPGLCVVPSNGLRLAFGLRGLGIDSGESELSRNRQTIALSPQSRGEGDRLRIRPNMFRAHGFGLPNEMARILIPQ